MVCVLDQSYFKKALLRKNSQDEASPDGSITPPSPNTSANTVTSKGSIKNKMSRRGHTMKIDQQASSSFNFDQMHTTIESIGNLFKMYILP